MHVELIEFPHNNPACLLRVPVDVEARKVIQALELPEPRALLLLNGATAELDPQVSEYLTGLFTALARIVLEKQITVLTGGTNAGIFALFGRALHRAGELSAPCLCVSAGLLVEPSDLEPHHSHFVLVDTAEWSTAALVMYRLAAALASECPSLTLFAGGGPITLKEMQHNVTQEREMILLAGSKGSTDEVIAAHLGEPTTKEDILRVARHGRLTILALDQSPSVLANLISNRLLGV